VSHLSYQRNEPEFVPVDFDMRDQIKKSKYAWRAAVKALGRALRHQYESKEEMPEHIRQLANPT
jgi:hypothetical protein